MPRRFPGPSPNTSHHGGRGVEQPSCGRDERFVVRAFVRLREFARGHTEIAMRLDALEEKVTGHDEDLREMFNALRALLTPSPRTGREIGFVKKVGR
jgi:hypothetical protein